MSAASNDNEQGSDMDEPMASQSQVSNISGHGHHHDMVLKSLHFMPPQNKTVSLAKFIYQCHFGQCQAQTLTNPYIFGDFKKFLFTKALDHFKVLNGNKKFKTLGHGDATESQ